MIISRKFAKKIDKKNLAELATQYANELADKLGSQTKIEITPQEIIYDPAEAERFFIPKFLSTKKCPKYLRDLLKISKYQEIKRQIKEKDPFIRDGVVYVPISKLPPKEIDLVSRIKGKEQTSNSLIAYFWNKLPRKSEYVSLNGLGAEIGHLVTEKLYRKKAVDLGETLDTFSQLFEITLNIKTLCGSNGQNDANISLLETEMLNKYVNERKKELELYETMLFEGFTATRQKLIQMGISKTYEKTEMCLSLLKKEYVNTAHFSGTKLFIEIYDRENGNLDRAYKRLGEILSNPQVTTVYDALMELGFSKDEGLKYKGILGEKKVDRATRIEQLKN